MKGELRHAAFQAVNGGFMAVGKDMQAVVAPADASAENLTFWLDTADVNTYLPSFFISKGIAEKTERAFLYNAYDLLIIIAQVPQVRLRISTIS